MSKENPYQLDKSRFDKSCFKLLLLEEKKYTGTFSYNSFDDEGSQYRFQKEEKTDVGTDIAYQFKLFNGENATLFSVVTDETKPLDPYPSFSDRLKQYKECLKKAKEKGNDSGDHLVLVPFVQRKRITGEDHIVLLTFYIKDGKIQKPMMLDPKNLFPVGLLYCHSEVEEAIKKFNGDEKKVRIKKDSTGDQGLFNRVDCGTLIGSYIQDVVHSTKDGTFTFGLEIEKAIKETIENFFLRLLNLIFGPNEKVMARLRDNMRVNRGIEKDWEEVDSVDIGSDISEDEWGFSEVSGNSDSSEEDSSDPEQFPKTYSS